MPVDLSSYKVALNELSSSTKFDNLVQAVQDALNALPPAQIVGYPSDATKFLRGDGAWSLSPMVLLGDIALDSVTQFTSIPNVYRALKVVWVARATGALVATDISVRFNADSGANYDSHVLRGNNSAATSATATAQTSVVVGIVPGANGTASRAGTGEGLIPAYAATSFHKLMHSQAAAVATSAAADSYSETRACLWRNTAAITQIDVLTSGGTAFAAGSRMQLYGIA